MRSETLGRLQHEGLSCPLLLFGCRREPDYVLVRAANDNHEIAHGCCIHSSARPCGQPQPWSVTLRSARSLPRCPPHAAPAGFPTAWPCALTTRSSATPSPDERIVGALPGTAVATFATGGAGDRGAVVPPNLAEHAPHAPTAIAWGCGVGHGLPDDVAAHRL